MEQSVLASEDFFLILCGIAVGTCARIITLNIDARQVPSYPNGYFINFVTGFIAACLGAVAVPALLSNNFTAVTFLTLAIQHFREFRKIERDSLTALDETEFTPRGSAYIDGIAKTYETRNYISLLSSFCCVAVTKLFFTGNFAANVILAAVSGGVSIILLYRFTRGKHVGEISQIRQGKLTIKGSDLYVDDIYVTNTMGTEQGRSFVLAEGIGLILTPKTPQDRLTLENTGQRQAILFEAIRAYGVRRYQFSRRSFEDGRVAFAFVPIVSDPDGIVTTMEQAPVLESSRKKGG